LGIYLTTHQVISILKQFWDLFIVVVVNFVTCTWSQNENNAYHSKRIFWL